MLFRSGNKTLTDSTDKLNEYIKTQMDAAKNVASTQIEEQDRRNALAAEVYKRLGVNVPGTGVTFNDYAQLTKVEHWLETTLAGKDINRISVDDTKYRDVRSGLNGIPGWIPAPGIREHTVASTVKINGTLMGTDKWGHFFQQGYWLLLAEKRGVITTAADRDLLSKWWEGDLSTLTPMIGNDKATSFLNFTKEMYDKAQWGIFGRYSTGVVSKADIAANEAGYQFYKALTTANFGTIIFQAGNYPTNTFNETTNPNVYDDAIRRKIINV